MNVKERLVYIGLIVLLLAGGLYATWRWQRAGSEAAPERSVANEVWLQQKLDQAEVRVSTLQTALDEQKQKVAELQKRQEADGSQPILLFEDHELQHLQQMGLSQPGSQVVADLVSRWDLLPIKGALGGTMMFRPSGQWVVTGTWVLAYFEDGHTGGKGIFRYSVKDGKITWTLVDWYQM